MESRVVANDENFYEGQMDSIFNIIGDGWYNLLAVYDEMEMLIEKHIHRRIVKSDLIESKDKKEETVSFDYDMKIIFNERDMGTLRVKSYIENFILSDFKDFAVQASKTRKQFDNSMLIPHGLLFMNNNVCLWKNAVAEEIIFRADLEVNDYRINNEGTTQTTIVNVNDYRINGFELTVIKIPVIVKKESIGSFVIIADNTLNKKNEKELNNKKAVIKEIHHRVKNNLQTIASLLRLQMRRVNSKTVEKAFKESINRISSIALIHEELSKGGIEKINIKSTIASIMEMILSTMIPPGKDIKGQLIGLDIYTDANKVSSLSLCVTELIQNSVEHAFLFRKKGTINVKIEESEGYVIITVEDDGIGLTRKKNKNSLGLEIIEMITNETLRGTFSIEGHLYGTQSQIKFPIK